MLCNGREIAGPGPERAVVFQNHSLLPWLNCFENVHLAVERVFGTKEGKENSRPAPMKPSRWCGMSHACQKLPARDLRRHEAAHRHRPRLRHGAPDPADGRAFGALDALTRANAAGRTDRRDGKTGATVVMVTHDVDEAVLLSDRVVMMTNGPAATIGEILEVKLPKPRDRLALAHDPYFIGMPRGDSGVLVSEADEEGCVRQAAGLRPPATQYQHNAGLTWPALLRLHAGMAAMVPGRERTRLTHGSPGIASRFDGFSQAFSQAGGDPSRGGEEGSTGTMVRR